jgi:hypothetical protein
MPSGHFLTLEVFDGAGGAISKVPTALAATSTATVLPSGPGKEQRQRERLKLHLRAHIRPVYSEQRWLEEVINTVNFNRNGLRFYTPLNHYCVGMILFVTVPYSSAAPLWKECLAEVVRKDDLPIGAQAVAVRFLS